MVNYVDYITLKNQWIDTEYDFVNDWSSLNIQSRVWYVDGANIELFNKAPTNSGPYTVILQTWNPNTTWRYGSRSRYDDWIYRFSLGWGVWIMEKVLELNITQDDTDTIVKVWPQGGWWVDTLTQPTLQRYKVYSWTAQNPRFYNILEQWRIYIWDYSTFWAWNTFNFYYFKLVKDWNIVCYLRACLDEDGKPAVYDEVNQKYLRIQWLSDSMIKTFVMSWNRQELPITDWIEKDKISNRIIEANKYVDWYAWKYDEICITADEDNIEWVMVSDYTEDKQSHVMWMSDFIELKPRWMLVLPRNRQITALNRPLVKGHKGDIIRIVVR